MGKCKECRAKIAINPNEAKLGTLEARFCNYTGYYFCPTCHWRDSRIIPARVVLNWDFCEYEVSRSSYRYLYSAYKRVLLNVSEENEQIFSFVEELQQIRKLRQDILRMKVYLSCCPDAAGARLLLRLLERQHFVESADEYSVHDLVEIANGSLIDSLTEVHADYARHIKLDCVRCQAKGLIWEICYFPLTPLRLFAPNVAQFITKNVSTKILQVVKAVSGVSASLENEIHSLRKPRLKWIKI